MTTDHHGGGSEPTNVVITLDVDTENGAPVDWVHVQSDERDALSDIDRAIAALLKARETLIADQQRNDSS
jgi:hypothetical protein